jgi:eukaryotic-like serine/threonine-protein kinase
VDPDIAQLVREQRLLEAAKLASDRGDARGASAIYEQACEWRKAAGEAMRGGDPARALLLAVQGADESIAEAALQLVADRAPVAELLATRLAQRGQHAWAARVLEAIGRGLQAARAWERAGDARRAAFLLEQAGQGADAARVLQAALDRDGPSAGVAVDLGGLLVRFGKWEAAVRVLQRVPAAAPERGESLVLLVRAFEGLGLARASGEAATELASLDRGAAAAAPSWRTEPPPARHNRLFGRYDVVREVASSPSARVLECVDVVRDERVAVKMFAGWGARGSGRDALARFEREVRAMSALDHPNVVPLRDYLPEGPAIALAWMSGGTLERKLSEAGALAPARAVEIASALLSALGSAHRLGILHRDIKPANVLFDEAGGACLSDFGVAHLGDVSTTATAGVFGTFAYMSPEQREGRPATARSDVFAVGVMLREMLTGERPGPDAPSGLTPSQAHRGLDARHDDAIARLTDPVADGRPADAFEAQSLLAALPWPLSTDGGIARQPARRASSPTPVVNRLEGRADGTFIDRWTERPIERVPLTERTLARARGFALADHRALQSVWRVDEGDGAIWLELLEGATLSRPLSGDECARLEGGLRALHAAGGAHGQVDAQHIVVAESGVVLRFAPEHDPTATPDRDRIALARLCAQSTPSPETSD